MRDRHGNASAGVPAGRAGRTDGAVCRLGNSLHGERWDARGTSGRAGRVRIWSPPSVGEQCLLLCAVGGSNAGFVLPALYCDAFPPPPASADVVAVTFADASTLSYDMAAHHLAVTLSGGSASLAVPGGLTIEGDVTVTGKIAASQDVTAAGISLKSHPHDKVQPGSGQSAGPLA